MIDVLLEPFQIKKCTLGVFPALAFAADFPPVAPEFKRRTQRQRLKNLGTTDKKSSRKIKCKKIPRVHKRFQENIVSQEDKNHVNGY